MTAGLEGRVAFITGGGRGQGRSHALGLARQGADIAIVDIAGDIASVPYALSKKDDLEETAKLVRGLGKRCLVQIADVRDGDAMRSAVAETVSQFGHVDILCANAGIFSFSSVEEMSDSTWQDMIDVNLTGIFNAFRAVAQPMREQQWGRVIATASMAGRGGFAMISHYVAAKWGLIGLSKSFALEMAPYNVTVNVVAPTNVNSLMIQNPAIWKFFAPDVENPTSEDAAKVAAQMTGQGVPWIEPQDVTEAILFLAQESSHRITGEVLHVSAGMNAFNAV